MPTLLVILLVNGDKFNLITGCVAQLVEQRSPKPLVGGSNPSALDVPIGLSQKVVQQDKRGIKRGCRSKIHGSKKAPTFNSI